MAFNKELLQFYQYYYHFELEEKNKINSRLNFPLAIITLIMGIVSFYLNDLPYLKIGGLEIFFYSVFICLILSIIFSFYFFIRCFYRYPYEYISTTFEINNYLNNLREYNKTVPKNSQVIIEKEFEDFLMDQYVNYATNNTKNNERKSKYLHNTHTSLIIALIFVVLTSIPFYIIKYKSTKQPVKVEISNLKEYFQNAR